MEGEARIPSTVDGERLHWVWRHSETGLRRYFSVFLSATLAPRLNLTTVTFPESPPLRRIPHPITSETASEPSVYRVASESLLERATTRRFWEDVGILDELERAGIGPSAWPTELLPDALRRDLSSSQRAVDELLLGHVRATARPGFVDQQRALEDRIRDKEDHFTLSASANGYSGPLYVYALSTESETGERVLEPRAPITLTWCTSTHTPAYACGATFRRQGWTGPEHLLPVPLPQGHRHVILTDGPTPRVSGFDESVAMAPEEVTPRQWHCRLFDIPDAMDETHDVAGAAHWDQLDHGQLAGRVRSRFPRAARLMRRLVRLRRKFDIGTGLEPIEHAFVMPAWQLTEARDTVCAVDPFECQCVSVSAFGTWSVPYDGKIAIVDG